MMDRIGWFLAQGVTTPQIPGAARTTPPLLSRDAAMILAIAGGLALLLFIWAFFLRKRRHPDPHMRVIQDSPIPGPNNSNNHRRRHGRRRHHRRQHSHEMKRNPTLQETGGLPPPRPESEAPKF